MVRHRAQVKPDHVHGNYKIAVWADAQGDLLDDLIHALEPLGILSITESSELPGKGYDYYFETEKGGINLIFTRPSAIDSDITYYLSPSSNDGDILPVKQALNRHPKFDIMESE